MKYGLLGVMVVAASVGLPACGSEDSVAADPNATVQQAFDVIGEQWLPPELPWRGPGPLLAYLCGEPRSGLSISASGMDGREVSDVRSVAEATPEGLLPSRLGPIVRIGAVRYSDDAAAEDAVRSVSADALEDCVIRTTHQWLDEQGEAYRSVPRPKAAEFATNAETDDGVALLQTTFEQEAIGGYDNSNGVSVAVGRTGPLVVTVVSTTSSQSPDPKADLQFVQDAVADLLQIEPA